MLIRNFILLLFLFCFCKEKKSTPFYFTTDTKPGIYLDYGLDRDLNSITIPMSEKWGGVVWEGEEGICIRSHSIHFEAWEFGPVWKICGLRDIFLARKLQESFAHLHKGIPFFLEAESSTGKYPFQISHTTQTEIEKILQSGTPEFAILGESFFEKWISASYKYYFLHGKNKNLHSSFSLPYPSLLLYTDFLLLVFPPSHFASGNKRNYIQLRFSYNSELWNQIISYFGTIEEVHQKNAEKCTQQKLDFTEYFGSSSGYTGKFIELQNSSLTQPACISSVNLQTAIEGVSISIPNGFLFPGEILLLKQLNTRLEGIEVANENFWKEIQAKFELKVDSDTYPLPAFTFAPEEGEFSDQRKNLSCETRGIFLTEKKICATPGIQIPSEESKVCKPKDFFLSEINAKGLLYNSTLDRFGKFIEFESLNKEPCFLDLLYLEFANQKIPIHKTEKVNWNDFILVGRKDYFLEISPIDRNLSSLSLEDKIFLNDYRETFEIFQPKDLLFVPYSSRNRLYSLDLNFGYEHHVAKVSQYLKSDYKSQNFMSPGEKNPIQDTEINSVYFSEIQIYGAYDTLGNSLTGEKFLELENVLGEGSIELRHTSLSSGKISKFLIKLEKDISFPVLSQNPLQCNQASNPIVEDSIPFPRESQIWELLYRGRLLDRLEFFPHLEMGIEDRTRKIRKSYSRTKAKDWKISSHSLSETCGTIFSSPGMPNSYLPYLKREGQNFSYLSPENISDRISIYAKTYPDKLKQYFIYPTQEGKFEIPDLQTDFTDSSLLYIYPLGGESIAFNREKIYISAVSPNPELTQNEWVLVCNYSEITTNLRNYEIGDSSHFDKIIPWGSRFSRNPLQNIEQFEVNSDQLYPNQCAYIIDPDANLLNLQPIGLAKPLLFTVQLDSTIGNGIGSSENLDLFKTIPTGRVLIHSYGNRYSPSPFTYNASRNEIIRLQIGKEGNSLDEYRTEK
jgi:hypothetical protein